MASRRYLLAQAHNRRRTIWHFIQYAGCFFRLSYSENYLPIGQSKFIDAVRPGHNTTLGYLINIEMAALDLSKVPQRYKHQKEEVVDGYKLTLDPLESVSYKVEFNFDLKDKDGFILKTIKSTAPNSLTSGTKNVFQATVDESIDYDTANKVHDILLRPFIAECYQCLPPDK
jgi:hypothetical protein